MAGGVWGWRSKPNTQHSKINSLTKKKAFYDWKEKQNKTLETMTGPTPFFTSEEMEVVENNVLNWSELQS